MTFMCLLSLESCSLQESYPRFRLLFGCYRIRMIVQVFCLGLIVRRIIVRGYCPGVECLDTAPNTVNVVTS